MQTCVNLECSNFRQPQAPSEPCIPYPYLSLHACAYACLHMHIPQTPLRINILYIYVCISTPRPLPLYSYLPNKPSWRVQSLGKSQHLPAGFAQQQMPCSSGRSPSLLLLLGMPLSIPKLQGLGFRVMSAIEL